MNQKRIIYLFCCVLFLNFFSCSKTDSTPDVTTPPPVVNKCSGTAGPMFTAVKTLMQSRCVGCHNNNVANGGMNFTVDCNIITNAALIKIMAVDKSSMPPGNPLSATDKAKITDWISAGGAITN